MIQEAVVDPVLQGMLLNTLGYNTAQVNCDSAPTDWDTWKKQFKTYSFQKDLDMTELSQLCPMA